jgi:predicted TPR repeat methyltransferase
MQNMENEPLADAYNKALDLEKSGDFDAAAKAYKLVLELDPDDHGGASVRLASMGKGKSPTRAPLAYVATLFDQHAEVFDKVLVEDLGYDVPKMTFDLLTKQSLTQFERMLDLGCGTGLMGVALNDFSEQMIGLDLSENMVEIAYDRDIYDALYVADVEDYLDDNDEDKWDLITAGDMFPYLGDIDNLMKGMADNLIKGGHVVFSTETLPDDAFGEEGFVVGQHQRFAHTFEYINLMLTKHDFKLCISEDITVRYEQGKPIFGHLILAQKQA